MKTKKEDTTTVKKDSLEVASVDVVAEVVEATTSETERTRRKTRVSK